MKQATLNIRIPEAMKHELNAIALKNSNEKRIFTTAEIARMVLEEGIKTLKNKKSLETA